MIVSEKKGNFRPHPETEDYIRAVIVDLTELKKRMTAFGEKEEFRIVYETEMEDDDGKRFCVWSRGYTLSLDVKSSLRKDLKRIMGRELTRTELDCFDLEELVGMGVKLEIVHAHKDDDVYANISTIKTDKTALKPSGNYRRVQDREPSAGDEAPAGKPGGDKKEPSAQKKKDWSEVVVHVGKFAGKKLGDVEEAGAKALIEKWLPKAVEGKKADDLELIAALSDLSEMLSADKY